MITNTVVKGIGKEVHETGFPRADGAVDVETLGVWDRGADGWAREVVQGCCEIFGSLMMRRRESCGLVVCGTEKIMLELGEAGNQGCLMRVGEEAASLEESVVGGFERAGCLGGHLIFDFSEKFTLLRS